MSEHDDGWRSDMGNAPKVGLIIVPGGIAHWYNGCWHSLTGESYPGKPITWDVWCWREFPLHWPDLPSGADEIRAPQRKNPPSGITGQRAGENVKQNG